MAVMRCSRMVVMVQVEEQLAKAVNGSLGEQLGPITKQVGLDIKTVQSALRTSMSFIGTFKSKLLGNMKQACMFYPYRRGVAKRVPRFLQ